MDFDGKYTKADTAQMVLGFVKCIFDLKKLPDLYERLSYKIDGYPWSGPAAIANLHKSSAKCFLKNISTNLGVTVG